MSLHLSARELTLLRETITVLTEPLETATIQDWQRRVNRSVRELLKGDQAVSIIPGGSGDPMFSAQYGEDMVLPYLEHYRYLDEGMLRSWERGTGAFSLRSLFPDDIETLLTGECYNDFHARHGIGDSVGMIVDPGPDLSPGLWIHHRRFGHPNAGERGTKILDLLLPAFRAGAAAAERFGRESGSLGRLIDALHEGAAIFDLRGRCLHRNRALRHLVEGSTAGPVIEGGVDGVARALGDLTRFGSASDAGRLHRRFVAGGRGYEVQGVRIGRPLGVERECALVTVRALDGLPSPAELRARYGLTPRHAEVALLLARRMTNPEMAEELCISPHTVRSHVEAVMGSLGLHDRRGVAAKLRSDMVKGHDH